jgi:hypothetical protein
MEKKHSTPKQKTAALRLRTETLRRLDDSELQTVAGGGFKIRIPIGFEDDTTPIYADIAG